ncbi:hypothetical protein MF451_003761 [Salmonella enterica subsp. enterica serovar Saintpaul]|nr:hypothetical protein [Salmonella enterica subsp. enterica serovar Saintpaul]
MRKHQTPQQLAEIITRSIDGSRHIARVAVPVELPHSTLGPLPTVALISASQGMDWDQGTLFLHPEQPLTPLSPDELAEIKRCRAEGQSWAVYQAHERWQKERDELVDTILKLRKALLSTGMSTADLELLAGDMPNMRPMRRKTPIK